MKQEHELPPNPITPVLAAMIDKASGKGTADTVWQLMQEFAAQAVEADRKRGGEPVAWYLPSADGYDSMFRDHATVKSCTGNPWDGWLPLYTAPVAPQPAAPTIKESLTVAEPVKVPSDDQWRTLMSWLDRRREYPTVMISGEVAGDIADLLARYGTQPAASAEPLFWYRPVSNGEMYEGPVHHDSVGGKMLRDEKPGEWVPLYLGTAPVAAQPSVPDILFDGWAVLQAIDHKARERTLAIHVSDVLDAVVRLMRNAPPADGQQDQSGYTAADMASQGAQGWRDGYDAARAQQEGK